MIGEKILNIGQDLTPRRSRHTSDSSDSLFNQTVLRMVQQVVLNICKYSKASEFKLIWLCHLECECLLTNYTVVGSKPFVSHKI